MNVSDFRDAIAQMVLAETGLPTGKVFWARQGAARPVRPFIELDAPEGLGPVEQAEQRYRVNPSPTADTAAVASVSAGASWIFSAGSVIRTVELGGPAKDEDGDPWQFTVTNTVPLTPIVVTWDGFTLNLSAPIGTLGTAAAAALVAWGVSNPGIFDFSAVVGNGHVTSGSIGVGFTAAFVQGVHGGDFFFIDNVTHPEVTVQLVAMSDKAAGSSDAMTLLQNLSRRLDTMRVTDRLDALGLSIVLRGTIQNISLELQNEYEGRAVMAVTIRMADSYTESVDRFESTKVESEIDQDDGNPPVTTTIIIP